MSAMDLGTRGVGGGGQMPSACHIICQSFKTHVCNIQNTLFNLIVSSYKCICLAFADENLSITSSKLMHYYVSLSIPIQPGCESDLVSPMNAKRTKLVLIC